MSTQISIKQLPQITEINNGNLLLVQQDDSTKTLDFKNFVIGLDNTTFGTTITQNSTNVTTLSSLLYNGNSAPSDIGPTGPFTTATPLTGLVGVPITIAGTNYNILLSATG